VNVLQLIWNTLANCHVKPRIVIPNQTDKSSLFPFPISSVYVRKPKIAVFFPTQKSALNKRGCSTSKIFGFLSGRFSWTPDWFVWCVCVSVSVSDIIPREHQTVLQQLPADTRPVASRWPPPHTLTLTLSLFQNSLSTRVISFHLWFNIKRSLSCISSNHYESMIC